MLRRTAHQTEMIAPLILHERLPFYPWMRTGGVRLPGLSPISVEDWLKQDEVFAAQMAYRDALVRKRRGEVYAVLPEAEAGARELLSILLEELPLRAGYNREGTRAIRPDGVAVETEGLPPLLAAGRLVQEDFALIVKAGSTHRLVGGMICFPANWNLADKLGKSLGGLHGPVEVFDAEMAKRTGRVFNNLRADTPLERANFLIYTNPDLHQPAHAPKRLMTGADRFVRVERQTLRRLPRTGAIVFAIHTYLVRAGSLDPDRFAALAALGPELTKT